MSDLFRVPDEDDLDGDDLEEEEEDPGPVHLLNRRSIELYFLAKRWPGVAIFPGPLIEWPAWWWHDERILRQHELRAQREARAEKKRKAWAEKARREMRAKL